MRLQNWQLLLTNFLPVSSRTSKLGSELSESGMRWDVRPLTISWPPSPRHGAGLAVILMCSRGWQSSIRSFVAECRAALYETSSAAGGTQSGHSSSTIVPPRLKAVGCQYNDYSPSYKAPALLIFTFQNSLYRRAIWPCAERAQSAPYVLRLLDTF